MRALVAVACLLLAACLAPAQAQSTQPADGFRWTPLRDVEDAQRAFTSPIDPDAVYIWTAKGLMVSADRGATMALRGKSLELGTITALLVHPAAPHTLYAGTRDKGVWLSTDAGVTWQALGGAAKGLADPQVYSLVLAPDDPTFSTLYATHSARKPGISMSIDGGKSWRSFARDYGVSDIAFLGETMFIAASHPAGGTESGFYRSLDAGKNWFRVLNVDNPTVLVGSRMHSHQAWCGTASGLFETNDFGVSTAQVGPITKDMSIASIALGYGALFTERIFAYEPTGQGVMASDDGFATWRTLNAGLYVGDWVTEGANLTANADGSCLYACINGTLYRGSLPVGAGPAALSSARVEPAAVVIGKGSVRVTCRAAPGAHVTIDLAPVGGSEALELTEDAQHPGTFSAAFEVAMPGASAKDAKWPRPPGLVVLPIQARSGAAVETAHALLYVLFNGANRILWDGQNMPLTTTANRGGTDLAVARECPLAPGLCHLHLRVDGPGQSVFLMKHDAAWTGERGGIDMRIHKLLGFFIRSTQEGPTDLRLDLRDDGSWRSSARGIERSNEVELSRYIPKVTSHYQFVTIPLADFILGSQFRPANFLGLDFLVPTGGGRVYDLAGFALLAQPGPVLMGPTIDLSPDGRTVRLSVRAASASGKLRKVAAELLALSAPGAAATTAGGGGGSGGRQVALAADPANGDATFVGQVPLSEVGGGMRQVRFFAEDPDGTQETVTRVFLPRKAIGSAAFIERPVKVDGDLTKYRDAQPLTVTQGKVSASVRMLYTTTDLYLGVEVKDPAFVLAKRKGGNPTFNSLTQDPTPASGVRLWLTSPTAAAAQHHPKMTERSQRIALALFDKEAWVVVGPDHRWNATGRKTDDGYILEAAIPLNAFDVPGDGGRCDFAPGRQTRCEFMVRAGDGTQALWSSASAADAASPENWGLLRFGDGSAPEAPVSSVPPTLQFRGARGRVLTLLSNQRLDPALAGDPASYAIAGAAIERAELEGDGQTVYLTAKNAWRPGDHVTLACPALKTTEGASGAKPLDFTILPGRVLSPPQTPNSRAGSDIPGAGAGPGAVEEFLVGELHERINYRGANSQDLIHEKDLRPARGAPDSSGGKWTLARSRPDGYVDLCYAVGFLDDSLAYAHVYVYSDAPRQVRVSLNTDDGQRLVVNGACLFYKTGDVGPVDKVVEGVHLEQGWNRVLVMVTQRSNEWGFRMRLFDADGKAAPPGVSYMADDPERK